MGNRGYFCHLALIGRVLQNEELHVGRYRSKRSLLLLVYLSISLKCLKLPGKDGIALLSLVDALC